MAVAVDLQRLGRRVGVDMEDWFSEDFPPGGQGHRPRGLLRRLEGALLERAVFASCTSECMRGALATAYGCEQPLVLYNAFPWTDRRRIDGEWRDRRDRSVPSIHWYSQTLGPGRGLEDLVAALARVRHDVELHLRGRPVPEFRAWLAQQVPAHRLFIHDQVPNAELLSRIAEHDVGFAGEMSYCRSRDLTATNKLLQYLLAGLAVVASDTTGQREIAARADRAVLLYPAGDPAALAARLDVLLGSPEQLGRAKAAALQVAETTFSWEREEPKLLAAVDRALASLEP